MAAAAGPDSTQAALEALLASGVLGAGGYAGGWLSGFCRAPRISGFVAAGCLATNSGAVAQAAVGPLRALLSGPSIGTIALLAGTELRGGHPGGGGSAGGSSSLFATVLYCALFSSTFVALQSAARLGLLPYPLGALPRQEKFAAALLCSGVATARSPASALAVVKELEASGPFTARCLQVSILLDAFTIFAFPFLLYLAQVVLVPAGQVSGVADAEDPTRAATPGSASGQPSTLSEAVCHLTISAALGHALAALSAALCVRVAGLKGTRSHTCAGRVLLALICVLLFGPPRGTAASAGVPWLSWDPMLVCLVLGAGGLRRRHEAPPLVMVCEQALPLANLCFFVLAGASLDMRRLLSVLPIALGLAGWRVVALRVGTGLAAAAVGDGGSPDAHRYWKGFITQAGISIALANEVRERFANQGSFGELVYTALMGQITVNQVVGPLLFRQAIIAAGDAPTADGGKSSTNAERERPPEWIGLERRQKKSAFGRARKALESSGAERERPPDWIGLPSRQSSWLATLGKKSADLAGKVSRSSWWHAATADGAAARCHIDLGGGSPPEAPTREAAGI